MPYTLEGDSAVATALRNAMYFDEDTLHRRSLEQEPIQNMEPEMDYPLDDEAISNEKKTKNPLLALQVPTPSTSSPSPLLPIFSSTWGSDTGWPQQMREELLAESNEFDFSEGSETSWAQDEDKTDDGTAPKLENKSE